MREEADPRCVEISALRRQVEEQEKELAALRKTVAERMDDIRKVAADHEKRAARYRRKAEDVLYSARRRGEQIKAQNALAQQRMAQLEAELQQLREDYEKLRRSVPTQAKSRNSGVRGTLRRYFRGRRDELLISRSGLFDEAFYLQ
ncbi:MAG TPA: hypothetical protein VG848_05235, partial [Acetobacteraceae bacterium]|nr:hypothetical protein [Acetobacteraceae bacterium]